VSRHISCLNDLKHFGIHALTGESDVLCFRILCDFTRQGQRIIAKALGVPDFKGAESWNSGTEDDPHVGSILLSRDMLNTLAIIALLESGCSEVWIFYRDVAKGCHGFLFDNEVPYGFYAHEPEELKDTLELADRNGYHRRRFAYNEEGSDRNVHTMSGRVT
jgi:hypothetical protein